MYKTKVLTANGSLTKVKSIAEYSPWSILLYFWPALSDNRSWKPMFGLLFEWPLKTGFIVQRQMIYDAYQILTDHISSLLALHAQIT